MRRANEEAGGSHLRRADGAQPRFLRASCVYGESTPFGARSLLISSTGGDRNRLNVSILWRLLSERSHERDELRINSRARKCRQRLARRRRSSVRGQFLAEAWPSGSHEERVKAISSFAKSRAEVIPRRRDEVRASEVLQEMKVLL